MGRYIHVLTISLDALHGNNKAVIADIVGLDSLQVRRDRAELKWWYIK